MSLVDHVLFPLSMVALGFALGAIYGLSFVIADDGCETAAIVHAAIETLGTRR